MRSVEKTKEDYHGSVSFAIIHEKVIRQAFLPGSVAPLYPWIGPSTLYWKGLYNIW